ncbi:unnamed protein product [Pseudo-nitzschia multistriata]|uniref:Cytochrome P450 n=1 Tax=Pseudo-nitzschia multistriata TaxID=183589 RepID=A0A448Z3L3_9STRA|nr:unnamed protein product [Pseudo-nitzschia multistriata]
MECAREYSIDHEGTMPSSPLAEAARSCAYHYDYDRDPNDEFPKARPHLLLLRCLLFLALGTWLYRRAKKDLTEKLNRKEVVPGFPSSPGAHWIAGHLMTLRTTEGGFVRGYEKVYMDHCDPKTGMGSFWFFNIPTVSLLKGADAAKVMRSSSYRKQLWLVTKHTRQFLGSRTILALMKKEWRCYRNAVHKSFTAEVVRQSRPYIYKIADTLADSLAEEHHRKNAKQRKRRRKGFTPVTKTTVSDASGNANTGTTEDESIISDDEFGETSIRISSPHVNQISDGQDSNVRKVLPLMKMATIDVFGAVALRSNGVDFGCTRNLEMSPLASAFEHLTTEFTHRLKRPWDPLTFLYEIPTEANRNYKRQRDTIRVFIQDQISLARKRIASTTEGGDRSSSSSSSRQHDLLSNLISVADAETTKADPGGTPIRDSAHDEALGDIVMTLLFGGYDTTSICLSYALYLLAKNPAKKRKLLEEVDAVLGAYYERDQPNGTLPPGPDELPYTKAVVLESLRLFPSVPSTARTIEKPTTIGGGSVTLQEGQMVMLPIWSIQRSEMNYPRPNDMIPERWVRRTAGHRNNGDGDKHPKSRWEVRPEDDRRPTGETRAPQPKTGDGDSGSVPPANREAFCAFAAGARNCVGKNLAVEETVVLLACLARRLVFDLVDEDYEVVPSIMAVVQQPEDGLPMRVTPRATQTAASKRGASAAATAAV